VLVTGFEKGVKGFLLRFMVNEKEKLVSRGEKNTVQPEECGGIGGCSAGRLGEGLFSFKL